MAKLPQNVTGIGACIPYRNQIYEVSGLEFCEWEDKLVVAQKYPDEGVAADWITFRFLRSLGFEVTEPASTESPPLNFNNFQAKQTTGQPATITSRPRSNTKRKAPIKKVPLGTIELDFYDLGIDKKLKKKQKQYENQKKEFLNVMEVSIAGVVAIVMGFIYVFIIFLVVLLLVNVKTKKVPPRAAEPPQAIIPQKKNEIVDTSLEKDDKVPVQKPPPKGPKPKSLKAKLLSMPIEEEAKESIRIIEESTKRASQDGDRLSKKFEP